MEGAAWLRGNQAEAEIHLPKGSPSLMPRGQEKPRWARHPACGGQTPTPTCLAPQISWTLALLIPKAAHLPRAPNPMPTPVRWLWLGPGDTAQSLTPPPRGQAAAAAAAARTAHWEVKEEGRPTGPKVSLSLTGSGDGVGRRGGWKGGSLGSSAGAHRAAVPPRLAPGGA